MYKPHGNHKPKIYNRHTHKKREGNPNVTQKTVIISQKKRTKEGMNKNIL